MKNSKFNFYLLLLSSFFGSLVFQRGIFIIFLISLKIDSYQIGILQSLLFFSTFISEIPTGILGDMIGKKKTLMLGCFFQILSLLLIIFRPVFSYLIVSYILEGISYAFFSGTQSALFFEIVCDLKKDYIKYKSTYNSMTYSSLGIAIFIGAFLQEKSWNTVYIATLIAMILSFICLSFIVEVNENEEEKKIIPNKNFYDEMKEYLINFRQNRLIYFIVTVALLEAVAGYFYILGQSLFLSQELSIKKIAFIYACIQIFSGIIFKVSSLICKKFQIENIYYFSIKFLFIGMFFILYNKNFITFLLLIIVTGFSDCLFISSDNYIQKKIPDKIRCTALSILSFFTVIITSIIYLIYGKLNMYLSANNTFFLLIIPLIISFFTCKSYFRIKANEVVNKDERQF